MEIKLSEEELHYLIESKTKTDIKLTVIGYDEFVLIHPKAEVHCRILGFTDRSVMISYDLGFWKNILVKWFVKFEKEGLLWNKRDKQIEIFPFNFFPEKVKTAIAGFSIREISLAPGFLLIQLGIIAE
jgi:hypothetical protein